jgi:hypothetical protein
MQNVECRLKKAQSIKDGVRHFSILSEAQSEAKHRVEGTASNEVQRTKGKGQRQKKNAECRVQIDE